MLHRVDLRRHAGSGLWALVALAAAFGLGACARTGAGKAPATDAVSRLDDGRFRLEFDSDDFVIERKMESMDGPSSDRRIALAGERPGEVLWLTAVRNQAIDPASGAMLSPEFLCHSNLSLAAPPQLARDTPSFRATDNLDERVMTLIQGQSEVELPPGFGFPIAVGEPLDFNTMVINTNVDELPFSVRVRTAVEYRRDEDVEAPMVPLFRRRIFTFVEAGAGGHEGRHGGHGHHEAAAAVAMPAPSAGAQATVGQDAEGHTYTMHWLVPPGRHEYRSRIRSQLRLPFDTTLHYAAAHLHPHGESIALVDAATGETLLRLAAHPYADRRGIAEMESFSSVEGLRFERDGDYELVTVYDNPTREPIDAMGILYLYLRDHGFERRPAQM